MQALKEYRSTAAGLPDLLNYAAMIDDGIVINKDGSLLAAWYYRGDDMSSATSFERNAMSAKINAILSKLGSGWITHHDAIRLPINTYPSSERSFFPDPITRLIDEERRTQFESFGTHYDTVYAVTISYMPPLRHQKKLMDMMITEDTHSNETTQTEKNPLKQDLSSLSYFKSIISEIEDGLSAILDMERMGSTQNSENDALLQYLHFCISGSYHAIRLPSCPMYLDSVIGNYNFYTGMTPKLNDEYIAVVSIDGFPQDSVPGILTGLDCLPISYRWSTRFIYLDPAESVTHLKKYRRKWQQKVRGFSDQVFKTNNGVIDQDALEMVSDSEDAIAEAASNLVTYGYYTSVIVLMASDSGELSQHTKEVRRMLQNLGFSCRIESVNTVEAWIGSLPGHGVQNIRRPMIHTLNLADMLPLSAIWPGRDTNPCPFYPANSPPLIHTATEGATPFRLNLHVGDVGHTLIFGPTGSGKSTLLALIAAQFRRYKDSCVFAFDKGNSLLPLTLAVEGHHYEICEESDNSDSHISTSFCPLGSIQNNQDQAWAEEWIANLLVIQGIKMTPSYLNDIHRAMRLLRNSPHQTLSDFATNLQDFELKEALQHYCIGGAMGHLLDSESDSLIDNTFQVFEIEELFNSGEKNLVPVLLYLFHMIEKRLTGQPTLLILDEAWLMLGHPVFREKIREWLKVLRKSNCAVILATQSLSDVTRSGIIDVLQESCPTKILLPNASAMQAGSRELYEKMGLNEVQIDLISTATPKRHYYAISPEGTRLFDLKLGPITLSFVGASGKDDIRKIKKLKNDYGAKWPYHWANIKEESHEKN